jgi:hypothetical protein
MKKLVVGGFGGCNRRGKNKRERKKRPWMITP